MQSKGTEPILFSGTLFVCLPMTHPRQASSWPRWKTALGAAAIVIGVSVALFPAMGGAFVWDDAVHIPGSDLIKSDSGLIQFWTSTDQADYWPIAYSTHWLEWRVFGDDPLGYRVINVALHITNSLLLWYLLRVLGIPFAWLCAAIFAVHPVNVEAIAWILQRKTLLSTMFAFSSLALCLERHERYPRLAYSAAIVLFAAGMLTKSSVVLWPATLLLLRWWQERQLTVRDLLWSAPFWMVSFFLGAVGVWFQRFRAMANDSIRDDDLFSRIVTAGEAVWFYAAQAVWPHDLCFVYPRWQLGVSSAVEFFPLVALLVLVGVSWKYRRSWSRGLFTGVLYYLLNLFPALGLVNIYFMRFSLVADHWQYLALPGLIALVVGAGHWACVSLGVGHRTWNSLGAGILLLLMFLANRHAAIYSGETNETLWRATLECNPKAWMAHNNLAAILLQLGDDREAEIHVRRALEINTDYPEAECTLGSIELKRGNFGEAKSHFEKALALNPVYYPAYFGKSLVLAVEGAWEESLRNSPKALGKPEEQSKWYATLGRLLATQQRYTDSIVQFQSALNLGPASPSVRIEYADVLIRAGDVDTAIDQYRQVLLEEPSSREALNNLAWVLATHPQATIRKPSDAIELAQKLCRISEPTPAEYLDRLAVAYAAERRFEEAIAIIELGLEQMPDTESELREKMMLRLDLFRHGVPYVENQFLDSNN